MEEVLESHWTDSMLERFQVLTQADWKITILSSKSLNYGCVFLPFVQLPLMFWWNDCTIVLRDSFF